MAKWNIYQATCVGHILLEESCLWLPFIFEPGGENYLVRSERACVNTRAFYFTSKLLPTVMEVRREHFSQVSPPSFTLHGMPRSNVCTGFMICIEYLRKTALMVILNLLFNFTVMRLTKPTLFTNIPVTCEEKDLPGK